LRRYIREHGTGLYNMLWLPSDATVVELDGHNMYNVVWVIANSLGLKHGWLRHAAG